MPHVSEGSPFRLQHFLRALPWVENFVLLRQMRPSQTPFGYGAVAQLIERVVRNDEVVGLIPICSTSLRSSSYGSASQPRKTPAGKEMCDALGEGCRAEACKA